MQTKRVTSVAFVFVPPSCVEAGVLVYLIFPFCNAPGWLVCLCHFRSSLADLARGIDSYLESREIDSCLEFASVGTRRNDRRRFFDRIAISGRILSAAS